MTDLPADPTGWAIRITPDGLWQPVSLIDGTELEPQPTKPEAVEAIEAHEAEA